MDACEIVEIDGEFFKNIKLLISLDSKSADDLAIIYCNKICNRFYSHNRANSDKLIKMIKKIPEISSKRILAHLSSQNLINDIKYMFQAFPELKKLSAFI